MTWVIFSTAYFGSPLPHSITAKSLAYRLPPDLILDNLPDYIVILEVYGRQGLLKDPRFWQNYYLRQIIPTDIYRSESMLIFERLETSN